MWPGGSWSDRDWWTGFSLVVKSISGKKGFDVRILIASLALACGVFMAAPVTAEDAPPTLTHLRIYADSNGESHFKEEQLAFKRRDNAVGEGGPLVHPLAGVSGAMVLHLKKGALEDWHTAPRRFFLVAIQGIAEVTASDGEVRRLMPGQVMLMDDTTGKGHQTRSVGDEDHVALVVAVE